MNHQVKIESGRAEFALKAVKEVVEKQKDDVKKEYKSYVRSFPSLVMTNGLAASIAFVMEKSNSKTGYKILYNNTTEWLKKISYLDNSMELEDYVCSLNSDTYRVITNEVLAVFEWLRRFASGLIEGEVGAE